jgi:hypothetical protein
MTAAMSMYLNGHTDTRRERTSADASNLSLNRYEFLFLVHPLLKMPPVGLEPTTR